MAKRICILCLVILVIVVACYCLGILGADVFVSPHGGDDNGSRKMLLQQLFIIC